jgi:hypothetical protein
MVTQRGDASPVHQLKVTLTDITPPIWRRIHVRGSTSLARLHDMLQTVMGWTDSHLHEFVVGDVRYGMVEMEWDPLDRPKDERRVRLGQVVRAVKDRFRYEYDFGDGWEHEIVVEKILAAESGVRYPRCIAGRRACPPEDVGGISGYLDFVEAIRDPTHPEHDDMLTWVGGRFDPEACDVAAINRELEER